MAQAITELRKAPSLELHGYAKNMEARKPLDFVRMGETNSLLKGDMNESIRYLSAKEAKETRKAHERFIEDVITGLRPRNHKKAGGRNKDVYGAVAKLISDRHYENKAKYQAINEINMVDSLSLGKEIIHHRLILSHPRFPDLYTAAMQGNREEVKNSIKIIRTDMKANKPLAKMNKQGDITFRAIVARVPGSPDADHTVVDHTVVTKSLKDLTYGWKDTSTGHYVFSTSQQDSLAKAQADQMASTYTIDAKTTLRFHEGTIMAMEDIDFEKTFKPNRPQPTPPPDKPKRPQPTPPPDKPKVIFYHNEGYAVEVKVLDSVGNAERDEEREGVRRSYNRRMEEHLNSLEQAVETGKSEFLIGQVQKIFREDMATIYTVKRIREDVRPAKEDEQVFYSERYLRGLQKMNTSEILALTLKDPEFLQPIHAYTGNIEKIEDEALRAGVSERELLAAWRQVISRQNPLGLESALAYEKTEQLSNQSELFTDRFDLHKICSDINRASDINTLGARIQGLAERVEAVIPPDATPLDKARFELNNVTIRDHNEKVKALKDAFELWDRNRTTESSDAMKMTAVHIMDYTAKNDYNRECQLNGLRGDSDAQATTASGKFQNGSRGLSGRGDSRMFYRSLMIKEELPSVEEEVNRKFANLRREIPETQEIEALVDKLATSRELVYEKPEEMALLVTSTIEELVPLMVSAHIKKLQNAKKFAEASIWLDQRSQREEACRDRLTTNYENSLKKYHDLKKLDRAHEHAMKHLKWYLGMFLGANADQAAANNGQDFSQAANNIFRMATQG